MKPILSSHSRTANQLSIFVAAALALLVSTTLAQSKPDSFTIESFPVGDCPRGMVSDGANIWVANLCDNTVTKLRASDGVVLGTFATGLYPVGLASTVPTFGSQTMALIP